MKRILIYFGIIFCLGCSKMTNEINQGELVPEEYTDYVEVKENGFYQEQIVNGLHYQVLYKSLEYTIADELNKGLLSSENIDKRKQELDGILYFNMRITPTDGNQDVLSLNIADKNDYINRSMYYSYYFNNDLKLITGIDTLTCISYHFMEYKGMSPYVDFVFAFDYGTNKTLDEFSLLINDQLFLSAPLKFNYSNEFIASQPKLEIENYDTLQ